MREDRRANSGIPDVAGDVTTGERAPGRGQTFVAADMILMGVSVDDVADWFRRSERVAFGNDRRPRFGTPPQPDAIGGEGTLALNLL